MSSTVQPMYDRFTRRSRIGRGHLPKALRREIMERDGYTCQYCRQPNDPARLTVDHLVPLALGGIDEPTNYVTACQPCNSRKAATPLADFALSIGVAIADLPIHGDPVIDNSRLPVQIRELRRKVIERARASARLTGKSAQQKVERAYRSAFWATDAGQRLAQEFPALPGHVRTIIPEIQAIAADEREFRLLVELAKSANTRSLIGSLLDAGGQVEERVRRQAQITKDAALRKRLEWALVRFERAMRSTRSAEETANGERLTPAALP